MPRKRNEALEQYLEHSGINDIVKRRTVKRGVLREEVVEPKVVKKTPAVDMSWKAVYDPPVYGTGLRNRGEAVESRGIMFDTMKRRAQEIDEWKARGGHHSAPNGEFLDKRIKKFRTKRTGP